ncbi:DoxX family membrane protein [Candidatus Parcubacteria bacterium]|nr:MAG: DoxX family membrane protein [Candidatus Parcubacteria bacterium]GIW69231.1 MAG: hypothetical protein KatS3mg100_725 [Candidatus Parcubacteria bacterium]
MFNVWPELFTYEIFAVALLRLSVAVFFLIHGTRTLSLWGIGPFFDRFGSWGLWAARLATTLQFAIGVLLLVGAWTQVAALFGMLVCLKLAAARRFPTIAPHAKATYYLVAVICLALMFLGGGAFAVDFIKL